MSHRVCFDWWRSWWLHGSLQFILALVCLKFSWAVGIISLDQSRLDLLLFWCYVLWRSHMIRNTRRLILRWIWILGRDRWLVSDYLAVSWLIDNMICLRIFFHVHFMIHFLRLFKIDGKSMNYRLNFPGIHKIRLDSLRILELLLCWISHRSCSVVHFALFQVISILSLKRWYFWLSDLSRYFWCLFDCLFWTAFLALEQLVWKNVIVLSLLLFHMVVLRLLVHGIRWNLGNFRI